MEDLPTTANDGFAVALQKALTKVCLWRTIVPSTWYSTIAIQSNAMFIDHRQVLIAIAKLCSVLSVERAMHGRLTINQYSTEYNSTPSLPICLLRFYWCSSLLGCYCPRPLLLSHMSICLFVFNGPTTRPHLLFVSILRLSECRYLLQWPF